MSDALPQDVQALIALHVEIEAGTMQLYRNVLGQPYVYFNHPKFPVGHFHLGERDFRGWVVHFIWDTKKLLLRQREVERILEELAGRSMKAQLSQAQDPALVRLIESEPVIAVVLEFMQTKTRHERTMEALWKELRPFARERRLEVIGPKRFPRGSNVLSRKLALFKERLDSLGIDVQLRRSDGCKVTLIRRSDDVSTEPSAESSSPNPQPEKSFAEPDDRSQRLAHLETRKKQSPTQLERNEP